MKRFTNIFCAVLLFSGTAWSIGDIDRVEDKVDVARDSSDNQSLTLDIIRAEAAIIESDIHHNDHVMGLAATPSLEVHRADHLVMTPFQATAGDDTFGDWLQILGSTDTPHVVGKTHFDLRTIFVSDVSVGADIKIHLVQVSFGATGAEGVITELMFIPERGGAQSVINFHSPRYPAGTKVWLNYWVDGVTDPTMDFHFVMHEYDE